MLLTQRICATSGSARVGHPQSASCSTRSRHHVRLGPVRALTLTPAGDGSQDHLDEPVAAPGPIQLKDGVFEVGRAQPADIIIAIPTVSTRHALLRVDGSKLMVTDLGSTNGTEVDDAELAPMANTEVPVGSTITFGDMYLARFKVTSDEAAGGPSDN